MSPFSKKARWWPAGVVLVLAGVLLIHVWGFQGGHRQNQVIQTVVYGGLAIILLLIWALLFSRLRWKVRLLVALLAIVAGAVPASMLRYRGVSGDVLPVFDWRWTDRPGEGLESPLPDTSGPIALSAVAEGPSYPQFLGPSRDATLTGIALARDWAARPPKLLWKQAVGAGWSGFAVVGGLAVTQEQRESLELVTAYELTTGRMVWSHADAERFEDPLSGPGPRATPTIVDGRVYAIGATGILNVLELATGEVVWSRNVVKENSAYAPEYGVAASPLVLEQVVVVAAGGARDASLVAYDRESGEPVWGGGSDPAGYSSPFLA